MRKHDIWRQLQLYWFIIVIMYLIKCVKKKNKNGKHFWDLSLQEQCLFSSCLSLLLINTLQSKYHQIQGVVQKIKKKEIKMLINSLFQCVYFSGYFLNLLSLGSLSKLLLSRFFVVLPIFPFFWLLWLRRWPKGGMFISSYSSRSQVFGKVRARTQGRDLKVGPWSSGVASRPLLVTEKELQKTGSLFCLILSQVSYTPQVHHPRKGSTCSGLGLSTSVNSKSKSPHTWP